MNNSIYNQLEIAAGSVSELRYLLQLSDFMEKLSIECNLRDEKSEEGNELTILSIPYVNIIYEEDIRKLAELTSRLKKSGLLVYKKEKMLSFFNLSTIECTSPFRIKSDEILINWRDVLSSTVLDLISEYEGEFYILNNCYFNSISIKSSEAIQGRIVSRRSIYYPINKLRQYDLNINTDREKQELSYLFFNGIFFNNNEITKFLLENLPISEFPNINTRLPINP